MDYFAAITEDQKLASGFYDHKPDPWVLHPHLFDEPAKPTHDDDAIPPVFVFDTDIDDDSIII